MNFLAPIPLEEAIAELARKKLVPTWLGSAELAELSAEVRSQALFSARMTQIRPLQALQEGLQLMLEGKANVADVKLMLTEVYRSMGYDSEKGGFPQDRAGTVPPALRGTLRDLASEQRMELIIKTQYAMATSAAFIKRGNDPQRLYQFPALELVRIASRRTPRGFTRRKGALQPVQGEDWPSRFVAAGGELFDKGTRLIALKGSPVWQALGDGQGGYTDTLGNPFSPFAFGSGWGLREVARAECLLLGVLEPESKATAMPETLKEGLKAQAKGLDPKLLAAFKKDLVKREDGSVRLKRMLEAETASVAKAYRAAGVPNHTLMLAQVLLNMGTRVGALKGWETRRRKALARTGAAAMRRAVNGRKDELDAMRVPGLGSIDFLWGTRGAKSKDSLGASHWGGWGIHHIHSKRGDRAVRVLPVVLARGTVKEHEDPKRRIVQYGSWSAIVERTDRRKTSWRVITLIDDVISARKGPRGGVAAAAAADPKNKKARLPSRSTGLTTQVRTGLEFPGSTHANQLFAEAGAGAAKDSSLSPLQNRCKAILMALQGRAAA